MQRGLLEPLPDTGDGSRDCEQADQLLITEHRNKRKNMFFFVGWLMCCEQWTRKRNDGAFWNISEICWTIEGRTLKHKGRDGKRKVHNWWNVRLEWNRKKPSPRKKVPPTQSRHFWHHQRGINYVKMIKKRHKGEDEQSMKELFKIFQNNGHADT